MESVGIVGIGTMGSIIAASLIKAGYPVVAFDVAAEARQNAQAIGAQVADEARGVARQASIVLLSLQTPQQVQEVVPALISLPPSGRLIIDTSTVDPTTTRRMAALARQAGTAYLDAPVLGRPASTGRWAIPVGGEPAAVERARPVLEAFAARVVHVGPSGCGHALKLLNQMMFAVINAITAEVLAVAAKLGVPPQVFVDTITLSGAATVSGLFCETATKIAAKDFTPVFSIDLLCKDTGLALDMAREGGAPAIITGLVQTLNQMAQARGDGPLDTAGLVRVYEGLLGISLD